MSWIEVVDSAVKIGLGALIAAIASLILSKSQHKRELRKEGVQREFELLKEIASQIERFTQASLKYWALTGDWHRYKIDGKKMSEAKTAELNKSQEDLFDTFHSLTSAEATLLLLGLNDAQLALRNYGDYVISFRRSVNEDAPMTTEQFYVWREGILKTRSSLFLELNAKYRALSS